MDSIMKIFLSRLLAATFFLQVITPAAYAESLSLQAPDIEPPVIKFNAGKTEISEGIKTFTAQVTDNRGVANVTLYYKNANDVGFTPKPMLKTGTNTYAVELSVDPVISKRLEFYIRAEDVSGNSVFEGQKFSPYAYQIVPASDSAASVTAAAEPPEEGMSTMTMILIGVGVLALAGGGGGGGGGSTTPSTGTVTITTAIPD
jgi:hypothetical protein